MTDFFSKWVGSGFVQDDGKSLSIDASKLSPEVKEIFRKEMQAKASNGLD